VKSELKAVAKDTANPFFKSKYATLNGHLEEAEPLLAKNGLMLLQPIGMTAEGKPYVETVVVHAESGQFVSSSMPLIVIKEDMQQLGAAATYARRFTLSALLSMQAEDLDGEDAVGRSKPSFTSPVKAASASVTTPAPSSGGFKKPTPKTETKPEVATAKKSNPVTDDSWS
jgi:hypothetical protein